MAGLKGRLRYSFTELKKSLGLPEDLEIYDFRRDGDDYIELKVWHESMPLVEEGGLIPVVDPATIPRRMQLKEERMEAIGLR